MDRKYRTSLLVSLFGLVILGHSNAETKSEIFNLSALNKFGYPEKNLISRGLGVKYMLIQVENYDKNADFISSAYSAEVEINEDNTSLKMTYQQATKAVLTMVVVPGKNQISVQNIWQDDKMQMRLVSTRRFNSSKCNLSTTDLFWEASVRSSLPPVTSPPTDKREHQTFCDSQSRPTKLISNLYYKQNDGESVTQVATWKWNDSGSSVMKTGWESESKSFFDSRGNPVTEYISIPLERLEVKTTYKYDSKDNWISKLTTTKRGPEEAKTLPIVSTEKVTREIVYW